MSLYLFDHEYTADQAKCREWSKLLPRFVPLRWAEDNFVVEDGTALVCAKEERHLVVVHFSGIRGSAERRPALKDLGIPLLIVSGDPGQGPLNGLESDAAKCYYRIARIAGREELDTTFRDLFAAFWEKYTETGELNWSSLEPEPWPRNLVAVYVVAKSAQLSDQTSRGRILEAWKRMDETTKRRVWRKAYEEYGKRGGSPEKWSAGGLPDLTKKEGDMAPLDFDEQKVVNTVETIQSTFPH